jgi:DNA processing protein
MAVNDALLQIAHAALTPRSVDLLLAEHGSAKAALAAAVAGRTRLGGTAVAEMAVPADTRREVLAQKGIRWLPSTDPGFPHHLQRNEGGPRWLFIRGAVPDLPRLAIVGTRTCTPYGVELAAEYGRVAAGRGWIVVSGLARGIDGAAHSGAVTAGGVSAAVLGSGIDVVYPRRHVSLHDELLATGGAVLSEFPPGTRPDGWRFPTRNRIIAGLADAVLVVEAGATGGALITARIALDYGIAVFATPGDVDRPASVGTNTLIRDGAFPVFESEDLGTVLDLIVPFAVA